MIWSSLLKWEQNRFYKIWIMSSSSFCETDTSNLVTLHRHRVNIKNLYWMQRKIKDHRYSRKIYSKSISISSHKLRGWSGNTSTYDSIIMLNKLIDKTFLWQQFLSYHECFLWAVFKHTMFFISVVAFCDDFSINTIIYSRCLFERSFMLIIAIFY